MGKVNVRVSDGVIETLFHKSDKAFRVATGLPPDAKLVAMTYYPTGFGICTFEHESFRDVLDDAPLPFVDVFIECIAEIKDDNIERLHSKNPNTGEVNKPKSDDHTQYVSVEAFTRAMLETNTRRSQITIDIDGHKVVMESEITSIDGQVDEKLLPMPSRN